MKILILFVSLILIFNANAQPDTRAQEAIAKLKLAKSGFEFLSDEEQDNLLEDITIGFLNDQIKKMERAVKKVAEEKEITRNYLSKEIPKLLEKGKQGDAFSIYRIGLIIQSQIMESGAVLTANKKDREMAAALYELAGLRGYEKGFWQLGRMYKDGMIGDKPDLEKAYSYFLKSRVIDTKTANRHDIFLRKKYLQGTPLKKLKVMADKGNSEAALKYGLNNINIRSKTKKARVYLEKSADKGNTDAAYHLAQHYKRSNKKKAIEWYNKTIQILETEFKEGNYLSAYKISQIHYIMYVNKLVDKLSADRMTYLITAADNNILYAQAKLGELYKLQKKYAKAVPYFEQVINNTYGTDCSCNMRDLDLEIGNGSMAVNFQSAAASLSRIYEKGLGIEQDLEKAVNYESLTGSMHTIRKDGKVVPSGIGANVSYISSRKLHKKVSENKTNAVKLIFGWTTWCPPCLGMMIDVLELKKQKGQQMEVYFIAYDGRDKLMEITRIMDIVGVDFKVYFGNPSDDKDMIDHYGNWEEGFPSTLIVNRSNTIPYYILGRVSKKELNSKINKISSY